MSLCILPMNGLVGTADSVRFVAKSRGEKFYTIVGGMAGYDSLLLLISPRKMPLRKKNGEWANEHLRELSLICSFMHDRCNYATAIVSNDNDAQRVLNSYECDDAKTIKAFTDYSCGVV